MICGLHEPEDIICMQITHIDIVIVIEFKIMQPAPCLALSELGLVLFTTK